ncbi:DUF4238 domain-containing protein [Spiroplasma platyhelix]|uniref:DUF4238 domain-containing protein n=1 Tax=Spiroplasma platyhelix PALS-1 TaxID=1276218 RepID=A0A846TS28_9MOLU|nr:DUF4238 domain-containing protein [Spiroplasma platyhelix]MBE4703932.1 hypothetical protein [Spiroplasma platyhelix PALS-1]NKE38305.1 DUF4238 domain-containing protein [Spiroplasma platyhelix PALS-1]UJB29190.1 hypothetical protein SPLAT_v1c04260 [Spiroplasma platyhelix PALS-1]
MSYTVNQHFLPQFMIKKWITINNTYKVYSKLNNSFSDISLKNKAKDVFSENEFYEHKNYLSNEIENKLSEMEREIANVFNKIIKSSESYKSLHLSRKDLKLIRLFYVLQMVRSKSIIIRTNNLDGDYLFNAINKNKNSEEIKNELISEINFLYNKIFKLIIKNELINWSELEQMPLWTAGYSYFQISNSKFLNFCKIPKDFNTSFVITDLSAVQMVDSSTAVSIVEFMPISPDIAIIFVTTLPAIANFERKKLDNIAKQLYNNGFKKAQENFGYLLLNRNIRNKYQKKGFKSYEDIFIYQFINLDSEETVSTINALMFSQGLDNILCKSEKDIEQLKIQREEKNISIIEEANR